jgi:coniferyl-aldehyde dehydrogenase
MMEVLGVVQGIDYLHRNLRRFRRPIRRHIALLRCATRVGGVATPAPPRISSGSRHRLGQPSATLHS